LAARGTKRICANDECGHPFYDLNKEPTDCPYCGEAFVAPVVVAVDISAPGRRRPNRVYRLEGPPVAAAQAEPASEDDDALVDADSDDEKADGAELDLVLEVDDETDVAADAVLGGDLPKDNAS
jgi:hypothetical protein